MAARSADLRSLPRVFFILLLHGAFSYLTVPDLATLGTVGPGVAGGVSSPSLMVTGLGGGGMAAFAWAPGDFPSDGRLLSLGILVVPVQRHDGIAAWCRLR